MLASKPEIFTVVLTGGIASGKTVVSDHFERLGAAVIDTDRIAREVVEPGEPALAQVVKEFGSEFLDSSGHLDRKKMRQAVFSDPNARQKLEHILHPAISAEVIRRVTALAGPYCILVIPLFAQSSSYGWVDRVLVVDVSAETQIQRVMDRDQTNREQARSILDAQSSRSDRLALADDIVDNSGSLEELRRRVEALHEKYLGLAGSF